MKQITKPLLEKALSMRRDFTIQEIAELLEVRVEELMEALTNFIERGDEPLPPVAETTRVKPDAKPQARSKGKGGKKPRTASRKEKKE